MSPQSQHDEARTLLTFLSENSDVKPHQPKRIEEALNKLKVLGRDPNNVSSIYNEEGIGVLGHYAFGDCPQSTTLEARRCIANALLLLPATRESSLRLHLDWKAADALHVVNYDEEFVLSRILFLLTYDPGIDINTLLLEHNLAGSIIDNLARHANGLEETRREMVGSKSMALEETLKLLFNTTNLKTDHAALFKPAVKEVLRILEPVHIPKPPLQPPVSLLMNALANLDFDSEILKASKTKPAVLKLITILENAIQGVSPAELDTTAIPLLTVLRKINEAGTLEVRECMKSRLLPDDQERDQPLGKSASLASQLLRLTTSSGMVRLSNAISCLMFELSDKDPHQYIQNVGYGYAAGYLMTHKIPIPETAITTTQDGTASSDQIPINPITGQRLDREPAVEMPDMTRAEQEREAERLFVLFERLKATGVVDVKNPVQVARDEGRFEELSDSDE